jgi:RNA polymerase sigma factor (sigma-70 family)
MAAQSQARATPDLRPSADVEFERLFELHSQRVLGYCRRQLGGRTEAEDAAQTVFLHALRLLRRGVVPEVESAWLFAIAHNVCRTYWRTATRRRGVEDQRDPGVLQETLAEREHDHDELFGLHDALARIPEGQRRALLLREWHGLPYREIATTLGTSQTAIEMLIFRARRSLAAELRGERKVRLPKSLASLGELLSSLKGLLGGSSALKLAAAGTAVATLAIGGSDAALKRATTAQSRNVQPSVVDHRAADARADVRRGTDSDVRAASADDPTGQSASAHATGQALRHASEAAGSPAGPVPAHPGSPPSTPRQPDPPTSSDPPSQPSSPHGSPGAQSSPAESPALPGLPTPPGVPAVPQPRVPDVPDVPKIPDAPHVPDVPQAPTITTPSLP